MALVIMNTKVEAITETKTIIREAGETSELDTTIDLVQMTGFKSQEKDLTKIKETEEEMTTIDNRAT